MLAELCACSVPVTQPGHEERAVAAAELHPNLCEAFEAPSHSMLPEQLSKSRLPERAVSGLRVAVGLCPEAANGDKSQGKEVKSWICGVRPGPHPQQ